MKKTNRIPFPIKLDFLPSKFNLISMILLFILPFVGEAQKLKYGQIFPKTNNAYAISVIHDGRSKMMLPVGAYRIPETSYIFFKTKKNNIPLFGALGVIVDDKVSTAKMKGKTSAEAVFATINLDSITLNAIKERLQDSLNYFLTDKETKMNVLTVRPCSWVVITDGNYNMTLEIEAYFLNESGNKAWKGLYGYTLPDNKPMFGTGSLIENSGELLSQKVHEGLTKCVDALLMDLKGAEAQWKKNALVPLAAGKVPDGSVLLEETTEDWIINRAMDYRQGFFISIVSKNEERLLLHPLGSQ